MSRLELNSQPRTDFRKSQTKKLRREGGVPATVYGRGDDPVSLAIMDEEFTKILKTPGGRLSLIDLKIAGDEDKVKLEPVMIQAIQRDPITKKVVHVDLHRVRMDTLVTARVPIQLVGEAAGVKLAGILEHFVREIEVKALPGKVPTHINVDVTALELGEIIHVGDVELPEGVELAGTAIEGVVATVRMPIVRDEEAAAAPETDDTAAPE